MGKTFGFNEPVLITERLKILAMCTLLWKGVKKNSVTFIAFILVRDTKYHDLATYLKYTEHT